MSVLREDLIKVGRILMPIPEDAGFIISHLENKGFPSYVVGGFVRDNILGIEPHDCDIATAAHPDQVAECFKDQKILETGIQHGTVTVIMNRQQYEVTTFREDGKYSDGRHPDQVRFVSGIEEDLARRDFTINAMAYSSKYGLVDPYGGIEDCENRIIRCVGSPEDRFEEDSLRILRAIRFAAQFKFSIERQTESAMLAKVNNLGRVSKERIASEFCKILDSDIPSEYLDHYRDIFKYVIPEFKDLMGFNQKNPYHIYDVWDHTMVALTKASSETKDRVVRLAVLFHDIGKPRCYTEDDTGRGHFYGHAVVGAVVTENVLRSLRLDNKTINEVSSLVKAHDSMLEPKKRSVLRWLNRIGEEQFRRILIIRKADISAQNPEFMQDRMEEIEKTQRILDEVLAEKKCFAIKDLAVNGNDIMRLGVPQGENVGKILQHLLKCVIDGNVENNLVDLLSEAQQTKRLIELGVDINDDN
mgnify:CR=1 FL=1